VTLPPTTATVHPAFAVGAVDARIFGGFLEHLGRAVYGGVYDPSSSRADAHGCRTDVLEALGALRMTAMRWPGGNFASGYHWRDGIGPADRRPVVREPAWKSAEPNSFGSHEFLDLADRVGWTPMLAVNLGTGTPEEAADWVEYCNAPTGTRWADQRAGNGREAPWGVPLWCLGNEMDGPWQLGHVPADEYGRRAQQAAMQMKLVDPSIETVVCGSSSIDSPTYGSWDRTVLEIVGTDADYLSLHRYVGNLTGELDQYLLAGYGVDRQIEEMAGVCRAVQAATRARSRTALCFDEWNVWYRNFGMDGRWARAPHLLEESYDLADALVCAQFLLSFIRHADVVKVANLAQIVNVIAPLLTKDDDVLVQTIYHPFRMISDRRDGVSLQVAVDGPTTASRDAHEVPLVDVGAIADGPTLHVFAVNRSVDHAAPVRIEVPGCSLWPVDAELLTAPDADVANTWATPDAVVATPYTPSRAGPRIAVELPPHSFIAATLTLDSSGRR
jgi:alpha-L-arabinofuranosidase